MHSSSANAPTTSTIDGALAKVPAVTLAFWLVKIAATTLGETAGDAVTMSLDLGYLTGTLIFAGLFVLAVAWQVKLKEFNSAVYWLTIVATTTVGTTLADFADRSLGIGYTGGSALLLALLAAVLVLWYRTTGSLAAETIRGVRQESFYWLTIMVSQTLGTALGDWTVDSADLGYGVSAAIFGSMLLILAALYGFTRLSRTALFWAAFVLTRPLGAVLGDFLDKPTAKGGLALSRFGASATLVGAMVVLLLMFRQKAANKASA